MVQGGAIHSGWVYSIEVNVKNPDGTYVGFRQRYIGFIEGRLRDITPYFEVKHFPMAGFY